MPDNNIATAIAVAVATDGVSVATTAGLAASDRPTSRKSSPRRPKERSPALSVPRRSADEICMQFNDIAWQIARELGSLEKLLVLLYFPVPHAQVQLGETKRTFSTIN